MLSSPRSLTHVCWRSRVRYMWIPWRLRYWIVPTTRLHHLLRLSSGKWLVWCVLRGLTETEEVMCEVAAGDSPTHHTPGIETCWCGSGAGQCLVGTTRMSLATRLPPMATLPLPSMCSGLRRYDEVVAWERLLRCSLTPMCVHETIRSWRIESCSMVNLRQCCSLASKRLYCHHMHMVD